MNEENEKNDYYFGEFRESDGAPILGFGPASASTLSSPFKIPYPVQRQGSTPVPGHAGQLRGYYRRSDGSDRWKPSWSRFGHPRSGTTHRGVDIYARVGTEAVAVADGYAMTYPNPTPGDELGKKVGLTIKASDGKKFDVLYGHLSDVVGESRLVKKGEVIGLTGCTGNAEDGACTTTNACGGYSSHLHVAVRESVSGSTYIDPVAFFGWVLDYSDDVRDVPCSQAFSDEILVRRILTPNSAGLHDIQEDDGDAGNAVVSDKQKSYYLRSFCGVNTHNQEYSVSIYESLKITLAQRMGTQPGLLVTVKGRERHFFHPALSSAMTVLIDASFQNVDDDGRRIGAPVLINLTRIDHEAASDTGLRALWQQQFVRNGTIDFSKPVELLGIILDEA